MSLSMGGAVGAAWSAPVSEAFGTAVLLSGAALRGPQCSSVDGGDGLSEGGCINEKRFSECCANQGAADGYCWDS